MKKYIPISIIIAVLETAIQVFLMSDLSFKAVADVTNLYLVFLNVLSMLAIFGLIMYIYAKAANIQLIPFGLVPLVFIIILFPVFYFSYVYKVGNKMLLIALSVNFAFAGYFAILAMRKLTKITRESLQSREVIPDLNTMIMIAQYKRGALPPEIMTKIDEEIAKDPYLKELVDSIEVHEIEDLKDLDKRNNEEENKEE